MTTTRPEHSVAGCKRARGASPQPRGRRLHLRADARPELEPGTPQGSVRSLPDDWDVLQVCLALELDPNLGPSYALLQRHPERAYATEALTARLVGSARGPLLSRASPLLRWEILQVSEGVPGVPSALRIDPHVLDFICDRPGVDPLLFECVSRISALEPHRPAGQFLLTSRIERALDHGAPVRRSIVGPRGSGGERSPPAWPRRSACRPSRSISPRFPTPTGRASTSGLNVRHCCSG